MSRARVLCIVSADFGEYVTASLFCRGQSFEAHFALPPVLAPFIPAGRQDFSVYRDLQEALALVHCLRPDAVILASGYLFAIHRLCAPADLQSFLRELRRGGAVVCTTDPWLRIWALRPDARFAIHSVRKGGVDAQMSEWMTGLQRRLEETLDATPHLFAVPLEDRARSWRSFFNPAVADDSRAREPMGDEWLFVLSREDCVFLTGFEKEAFYSALEARIGELLEHEPNRLRFIAPPDIGRFLAERWPGEPRLTYGAYCDFASFERLLREARVVAYWNLLSASLLYCLYHHVPPVFFGAGHLAKVCPALEAHAGEHVYCGRPPQRLDLAAPIEADAGRLVRALDLDAWLAGLRVEYRRSAEPAKVLADLRQLP